MTIVTLCKGSDYVYPSCCPCCLGAADFTERIEGKVYSGSVTRTAAVTFPVCQACLDHRRVGQSQAFMVFAVGVLLFVLGGAIQFSFAAPRGNIAFWASEALAVLFVASLVAAPAAYFAERWRWPKSHPPHASAGPAVRAHPFSHGLEFHFANAKYGDAVAAANESSLSRKVKSVRQS